MPGAQFDQVSFAASSKDAKGTRYREDSKPRGFLTGPRVVDQHEGSACRILRRE